MPTHKSEDYKLSAVEYYLNVQRCKKNKIYNIYKWIINQILFAT
jgi:hypothetical protein